MTNKEYLKTLRTPTNANPLRVLVSSCLTGIMCGVDGSAYGEYPSVLKLLNYNTIKLIPFCPENYSFGTPREMCDIHGGTGFDVLDGKARVITETGVDWTDGMVKAAEKMLEVANKEIVDFAIMMDVSAACGSQVIYEGNRLSENKVYQIGAGVCAAHLRRAGIKVYCQRDLASLEILYFKIDNSHRINTEAKDHHETSWYIDYFGSK